MALLRLSEPSSQQKLIWISGKGSLKGLDCHTPYHSPAAPLSGNFSPGSYLPKLLNQSVSDFLSPGVRNSVLAPPFPLYRDMGFSMRQRCLGPSA